MLASLPVSMLNQSLDDLGIPIRINLTSSRSSGPQMTGGVPFQRSSDLLPK